jgi:hypothetical protein
MQSQAQNSDWNQKTLSGALLVLLAYAALVPDLTREASAKSGFALVLVALLVVRMIIASFRKEKGSGWLFYFWLIVTSPLWIEVGSRLAFGS